jgi:hypothetical protein
MDPDRVKQAYAEQFGTETTERQTQLAKALWPCCGEHRDGPHHEACAKYVADPTPEIHPDQSSLL